MSRGDKNLDQLFKDAFSGQQHEVVPAFWQEAQQLINANKVAKVPFYAKPLVWMSAIGTLAITAILFSVSTPENEAIAQYVPASFVTDLETENTQDYQVQPSLSNQNNFIPTKSAKTITLVQNTTTSSSNNPIPVTPKNARVASTIDKSQSAFSSQKTSNSIAQKSIISSTPIPSNKAKGVNTNNRNETISTNSTAKGATTIGNTYEIDNSFGNTQERASNLALFPLEMMLLKPLEIENSFSASPENQNKKHKNLSHPFNIRASVGAMRSNKEQMENSQLTYQSREINVELSLEYQFKSRWGVQAGFKYSELTNDQSNLVQNIEDLSYWNEEQNVNTTQSRVWWLGGWYYYPPVSDTTTVKNWVNNYDTASNQLRISHHIRLIEIPLLVTYNYGIERFNLQLSTGVSLGFPIGTSGSIFASDDPFPTSMENNNYLNAFQTSLLFQSELSYGLSDNWWLSMRPQLKYNVNSIYNSQSTSSPQMLYYGLNVGVIYKL